MARACPEGGGGLALPRELVRRPHRRSCLFPCGRISRRVPARPPWPAGSSRCLAPPPLFAVRARSARALRFLPRGLSPAPPRSAPAGLAKTGGAHCAAASGRQHSGLRPLSPARDGCIALGRGRSRRLLAGAGANALARSLAGATAPARRGWGLAYPPSLRRGRSTALPLRRSRARRWGLEDLAADDNAPRRLWMRRAPRRWEARVAGALGKERFRLRAFGPTRNQVPWSSRSSRLQDLAPCLVLHQSSAASAHAVHLVFYVCFVICAIPPLTSSSARPQRGWRAPVVRAQPWRAAACEPMLANSGPTRSKFEHRP